MIEGKRYKVAVIGAGIGATHIASYRVMPEKFEVAAVCDLDTERAAKAVAGLSGTRIVSDMEEIISDPEIDIIDVSLPPFLHHGPTMRALSAGKHVICEKPFATSQAEAQTAVDFAEKQGLKIYPCFQYRYGRGFYQLTHLVRSGWAGKPYVASLETHWKRGPAYYEVPWRGTWKSECGGAVVGHAIHIHNLATHLLGPVRSVAAMLDTRVNPIETEDCGAISFQMESGALVTSSITLGAATDTSRFRVCFQNVTAESGQEPYRVGADGWVFTASSPERQGELNGELEKVPEGPARFEGLFEEIYKDLQGDPAARPTNADDALHSTDLISAIYESARNGTIVHLPLTPESEMYKGWIIDTAASA